jgi:transcriptional regulator with PAS, ATPase and Fis domain
MNMKKNPKKTPVSKEMVSWDAVDLPDEAKVKQLKDLVLSYTKNPKIVNVDQILYLANETGLDSYPEVITEEYEDNYVTMFHRIFKGRTDSEHYTLLAGLLFSWDYDKEALNYLDKGIESLPPGEIKNLVEMKGSLTISQYYIGASKEIRDQISVAAWSDLDILIEGDTGTGKEVVANLIHKLSRRSTYPFRGISFAEIPKNLIESVLFGYVKGSFTGAISDREGLFQAVKNGILFLDETNDLVKFMQAKLLRVLQEKEVWKVGSIKPDKIEARVLFGTNKRSIDLVREKRMREDFFYRISPLTISLSPLRERGSLEFLELVEHFWGDFSRVFKKEIELTPSALERLYAHDWPGNVRELENLIKVVIATTFTKRIEPYHINQYLKTFDRPGDLITQATNHWWDENKIVTTYQNIVISHCRGNIKEASGILGINESTLRRRLQGKAPRKK